MDQLPSSSRLRSSCVKLYLCSNPADTVVERKALREVVFPKLEEHCRHTLGVDLRVIDPYESSHPSQWPDENTRKALIKECRESSTGPFFLALIGHDYGRPNLPALVEVSHFHMLLQQIQQAGLSTRQLEKVYHRDENTCPPSFCLRTTCGPQEDLMTLFETAVSLCVDKQLLTEEEAVTFNRSVLDGDLRFALENCPRNDILRRCLVYVHKVVNPKVGQEARRQSGSKLHKVEASYPATSSSSEGDLLSDLIDNFLRGLVDSCQLAAFTSTTECDPRYGYTTARRRGYAEVLCHQVHSDLMRLIDSSVTNVVKMGSCYLSHALAREGVEQEEHCAELSRFYDVIRPEADQIRAYVQQSDNGCPLVLTGGPCAGKSVLLAHCAQQMKYWLPDVDPVVITFFNHFPHPPSVVRLLSSLCYQIIRIYDQASSAEDVSLSEHRDNESSITPTWNADLNLKTVLRSIKKPDMGLNEVTQCLCFVLSLLPSPKQPLVLILDGVDQMGHHFAVELIERMPSPLLPRVKLILSISSNQTGIIQLIKQRYRQCGTQGCVSEGAKCVPLASADRKQCFQMLMSQLSSSGRRVTSGQLVLVNKALTSCCLPLYVRLLHRHTSLWCSDSDVLESCLPDSIHSSIAALLNHLEHKYTSCLVSRAVSYLTLCSTGLTEGELAALLSRVESCQVTQVDVERLLLDLSGFLIRRTAMGCQVLFWVSRHFGLVVAKTYLCTGEARGEIHSEMADYFSRGLDFASTPAQNTERGDRNTEEQPSLRDLANARGALELMHHLRESNRLEIRIKVLLSWRFHRVLVQAGLLRDLVAMLRQDEGKESRNFLRERTLLASIFTSSSCLLESAPVELPTLMEASLLPYVELFPVLKDYVREIRMRSRGLTAVLSPAPDTVVCLWRLELDNVAKHLSVIAAAGTHSGTVAELMSDGSAWIRRDVGSGIVRLSLSQEKSEIKFAGVKSSHGFLLFSTLCNKLFLYDDTAPDMLVEVKSAHTLNLLEGFVACEKQLCMWWKREHVVDVFDASSATLSNFHCQSCVTCVVFSSGGSHVYCGQEEGTVSIFDIHHHSLLLSCSNSNQTAIVSIILSENNQEIACIGKTGCVTLWDVIADKQSKPRLVKESSNEIECNDILNIDYSDECSSLLLCHNKYITVWDTCEWEMCDQFLAPHDGAFIQAVFSQDGHLFLALLDACPRVLVWMVSTGLCVLSLDTHKPPRILLKTTSEIVCVADDGRLSGWDSGMIYFAGAAPKMGCGVEEVVMEQTGCWFYTADGSEMVWRWKVETGLPHSNFLHDSPVKKVRLSRDDVTLVTLSGEEIYVWRTETGQNIVRICGSAATDILTTPNSNFGVSISEQGLSRVWKLAHGSVVCTIHLYLCDAQVSPESTFLIGRHSGNLLAASLWSGMISKRFSREKSSEDVVAFHTLSQHPDFVVVMVASGVIYTWKMSDETVCRHFQLPETFYCQPQHFQMTSDGSFALLSTDNAAVTLLDVSQVRLCSFKAEGSVMKACLDEAGCYIAYISHPTRQEKGCACTLHTQPILTIVQLSDGKKVGRVFLCKDPLTLLIHGRQYVFVGFRDGSVGVYSISGHTVRGADGIGDSENLSCHLKECYFDTVPMTWFPLATPNITWS